MLYCSTTAPELEVADSLPEAPVASITVSLPASTSVLSAEVKGVAIAENVSGEEEDHHIVHGEKEPDVLLNKFAVLHPEEVEVRPVLLK